MFNIFRALLDRLKALFATTAAQELETEFLARHAERKAELLRRADLYESEGLTTVAQDLRQQAETLNIQQPLGTILPAIEHWQADSSRDASLLLGTATTSADDNHAQEPPSLPTSKKKGR